MVFIVGLIALAIILPASAAGHNGDAKMMNLRTASGQDNNCEQNKNCLQHDCQNNQTPPQDGTGQQYAKMMNLKTASGQNNNCGQNPDCQHDCQNNQTPPQDGTGQQNGNHRNVKTG